MARNKINLHNDFLFKKRISTSNNVLSNLKSYTVESTPEVKEEEETETPEIEVEEPKTEETPEVKEETPEVKEEEETETEEEDSKTEEETPETGEEEPKTEVASKARTVSKK